jgi:hypothetical protein
MWMPTTPCQYCHSSRGYLGRKAICGRTFPGMQVGYLVYGTLEPAQEVGHSMKIRAVLVSPLASFLMGVVGKTNAACRLTRTLMLRLGEALAKK